MKFPFQKAISGVQSGLWKSFI